jgi:hypothetical protein
MASVTAKTIAKKLSDPATLARFVANPKAVARQLGVDLRDPVMVAQLERLARSTQHALAGAAVAAGIPVKRLAWGIGAGCCNGTTIAFGKN